MKTSPITRLCKPKLATLWPALLLVCTGIVHAQSNLQSADCPQPRFTGKAPDEFYTLKNPLPPTPDTFAAGQRLYRGKRGAVSCMTCHGEKGDGKGELASQFSPPPRNFRCTQTINGIPDGQLFWIIRNGSPGTAMPSAATFGKWTDDDIWQIVAYLRQIAR
jgi:hypothetical protein